MTQTQPRPKAKRAEPNPSRFKMTDFKKVATSGEVESLSALARNFGIDKLTAERTCKIHGITPSFVKPKEKPLPVAWYVRAYRINDDRTRGEMHYETAYFDYDKAVAQALIVAIQQPISMTEVVPVFP